MDRIRMAVATALGLGLSPIAPGTCGALLGLFIHGVTYNLSPAPWRVCILALCFVVTAALNHLLTPWAQRQWQDGDPKQFVLDEVAGYLLVAALVSGDRFLQPALWGFALFRVIDIVKLPPARQVHRMAQGAWCILLDDVISATYAAGAIFAIRYATSRLVPGLSAVTP